MSLKYWNAHADVKGCMKSFPMFSAFNVNFIFI